MTENDQKRFFPIFFSMIILGFIIYNFPVFQQIFANAFYKETVITGPEYVVKALKEGRSPYNYMTESFVGLGPNLNVRDVRDYNTGPRVYEYVVEGKTYSTRKRSYIGPNAAGFILNLDQISYPELLKRERVYYFPLIPSIAIADNSLSDPLIITRFVISLNIVFACSLIYFHYRSMQAKLSVPLRSTYFWVLFFFAGVCGKIIFCEVYVMLRQLLR